MTGGSIEGSIRQVLTTPADFEALEADGSTRPSLSEQVIAAMVRAALTREIPGVVFNEIVAHRDGAGQIMKIEIDYMDAVHDPSPQRVTVDFRERLDGQNFP